jgi:dienelactone hydrolase
MMRILKSICIFVITITLCACSSSSDTLDKLNLQNKLSETSDLILLESKSSTPATIGFVYYPGGLVDPHAYLQWQDKLISQYPAIKIITVKMPSNLAVFGITKGIEVTKDFPGITNWITGGHSLGGTMAAELVNKYPTNFKALIFIASYPASDILKNWDGAILSVHASKDGLSTASDIEQHKADLPAAKVMIDDQNFTLPLQGKTHYYEIMGGNHGQFGNYGIQTGDSVSTISRTTQQSALIQVIQHFISKL